MTDIQNKIMFLKHQKNATILAHYYQAMDIQEISDFVGDSFELARRAQTATQSIIVLCGVRFMAESAKILNPEKTVLIPVPDAGCPMADMVTPEDVRKLRNDYPGAAVMCYVNSSAAVKAESDICCTSSSAVRVAKSLNQKRIIFIPDQNLGSYVASQVPEKEFILFSGFCPIHHRVSESDVISSKTIHSNARVLVHPECPEKVTALADYVGSTAGILNTVIESPDSEFIIGTEIGVTDRLKHLLPEKSFYPLSKRLICADMKKTTTSDVLKSLEEGVYEISLAENELNGARASLERMMKVQ